VIGHAVIVGSLNSIGSGVFTNGQSS